ncbi:MAG TPA: hypothetical protein ENG82_06060 [Bacteroidetes bacterium]|nr:hypothetical protein [Bacteroidota bacterium]
MRSNKPIKSALLAMGLLVSVSVLGCKVIPGVSVFGHSWNATIKSPFGLTGTIGKPHIFKEVVRMYGSFGPVVNSKYLDKYYFSFHSKYLEITNDTVNPNDPNDNLNKIWTGYGDSGQKSNGSHEVFISGRCSLYDKLGLGTGSSSYKYELRLYKKFGNQPHRFELKILMADPKDNYVITGTAVEPNGTIFFR